MTPGAPFASPVRLPVAHTARPAAAARAANPAPWRRGPGAPAGRNLPAGRGRHAECRPARRIGGCDAPPHAMLLDQPPDLGQGAGHDGHTGGDVLEQLVGQRQAVVLAGVLQQRHAHVGLGGVGQQSAQRDARAAAVTRSSRPCARDAPAQLPAVARLGVAEESERAAGHWCDRGDQHLAAARRRRRALVQDQRRVSSSIPRLRAQPSLSADLRAR